MDKYTMDPEKDTLFRGEFEVVKELIAAFEDGPASKAECDKVIDKNGPPPKGTGIKQLRENIAESKLSYEIMDDAAQVGWNFVWDTNLMVIRIIIIHIQ